MQSSDHLSTISQILVFNSLTIGEFFSKYSKIQFFNISEIVNNEAVIHSHVPISQPVIIVAN
jgi:hypothetical protein